MDRLSPLITFTCFYSVLAILNILTNSPPAHLPKKKQWDYLGQHISFIHSVLSIVISLYVYFLEGGIHYLQETNFYHLIVISVIPIQHSLGYFFYDMIYAEIFSLHDWAMRTHHLCVLLGGTVMYIAETGGSPATICILITEGSNPFMMLRKIMRSNGQEKTRSYKIIELIFAVSFILLRAFLCTFINYNMWLTRLSLITKLSISITYGVGFFWIYTILTIALKQMPEKSRFTTSFKSSLDFIKAYSMFFVISTFIWAILLPYVLTQVCGYGFISLVIKGFIVF